MRHPLVLVAIGLVVLACVWLARERTPDIEHSSVEVLMNGDERAPSRVYDNAVVHSGREVLEIRDDTSYRIIARIPRDSVYAVLGEDYLLLVTQTVRR